MSRRERAVGHELEGSTFRAGETAKNLLFLSHPSPSSDWPVLNGVLEAHQHRSTHDLLEPFALGFMAGSTLMLDLLAQGKRISRAEGLLFLVASVVLIVKVSGLA